jgi:hypothetical protein
MFKLRPNQPTQRRGKSSPPPQLPKPRPASLRSTKRTLAQQLGVRPNVSAAADKLEQTQEKQKEKDRGPTNRLPVPKAIQIMGADPIRDAYLERGNLKKDNITQTPKDATNTTPDELQDYVNNLASDTHSLNLAPDGLPQDIQSGSFMDQLKNFGN